METNRPGICPTDGSRFETKNFGAIEVQEQQVIKLAQGLLGFPDYRHYILIEHKKDSPFVWLQSLDDPGLAFAVIDPYCFMPDYQIGYLNGSLAELGADNAKDLNIFVIVTIPKGRPQDMTVNLLGPVVINIKNRLAKQLVLDNPKYTHRYRVIPS
jgi:flagellar assembly factor FliW